jgi:hypothetical protein
MRTGESGSARNSSNIQLEMPGTTETRDEAPNLPTTAPGLEAEALFLTPEPQVQLHAWFCLHCRSLATLLCWHGNAGNLGDGRR